MNAPLYNARILRLAASIPHDRLLPSPQARVRKVSPVCGSRVTADVVLDDGGRIADFGQEVRACALGQASAAILGAGVIGQTGGALRAAHAALAAWLRSQAPLPTALAQAFPDLLIFDPARAHPARHASILLAFDAAAAAAEMAETGRRGG